MAVISKEALNEIIFSEVSSEAYYNKYLSGITVPPNDSGATIGIGYDLGYATKNTLKQDWLFEIGTKQCDILNMFIGIKGDKARNAVQNNPLAKQVKIPFKSAYNVFIKSSLPSYYRKALSIYPGLDKLEPNAIGAVVSLVYNRGTSLDGDRRKEMKELVSAIANKDYKKMAALFRSMKRLWDNGLVSRREREAVLIDNCQKTYDGDDLIQIT